MGESVSVVVTCHNLEKYIAAALESVRQQDHDGPVEVIVVDDCSTDGSAAIIQAFDGVKYVRTPENCGVLLATVLGMEHATGDVIFFLDGDDLWSPEKLKASMRRFAEDERLALVTHDLGFIDAEGLPLEQASLVKRSLHGVLPPSDEARIRGGILFHRDFVWLGSAYAIRPAIMGLEEFCAFAKTLPDPRNTYQDWPLAFWVAAQGSVTLGYIDRALFLYRLHGANHSGDSSSAAKAVRNHQRAANTTEAMLRIAQMFDLSEEVKRVTGAKLAYGRYLVALYRGERWSASKEFLRGLPFLGRDVALLCKESVRFLSVQVAGAGRFTRAMNFLRRLKSNARASVRMSSG